MENLKLGELEELVMLAVGRLYPEAYGVSIKKELLNVAGRKVTLSTVHEILNRLGKKKFLESEFGEATKKRGGKRKKYFKITVTGSNAIVETRKLREEMWKGISKVALSTK